MFLDIFIQIVTAKEFIIILVALLILFPIIFAVASRNKKPVKVKKVPKKSAEKTEKKSLKNPEVQNPAA